MGIESLCKYAHPSKRRGRYVQIEPDDRCGDSLAGRAAPQADTDRLLAGRCPLHGADPPLDDVQLDVLMRM